jgi:hypothetical protein
MQPRCRVCQHPRHYKLRGAVQASDFVIPIEFHKAHPDASAPKGSNGSSENTHDLSPGV